jgi:hypothetical protein
MVLDGLAQSLGNLEPTLVWLQDKLTRNWQGRNTHPRFLVSVLKATQGGKGDVASREACVK